MATKYATHFSTRSTPQSEPIPGKPMVKNSAEGFSFHVDDWKRLDRFLILGCEGGTYYASEKKLAIENADCVRRCALEDGIRAVDRIVEISNSGRAPKNDPAIFALAICAGLGSTEAKAHALKRMPEVCRIGTHLFQFIESVKAFRGWGPALRRAVANWYNREDAAFQCVKYQQRNGVSHRDVLRLCHRPDNSPLARWVIGAETGSRVVKGSAEKNRADREYGAVVGELPGIVLAFEDAKRAESPATICRLIEAHNLPRECVPTKWLNEPAVWESLLQKMPLTALVRNLGKMSAIELLKPLSSAVGNVLSKLSDEQYIRKSRLHPVAVLAALLTYRQGHGERGKLSWSPVSQVVDALDSAFYKAFGNVESTGKRWLLGLDVSGSMEGGLIAGVPGLTPRVGVGALALVTAAVEPQHHIVGFTSGASGEWAYGAGSSMHSRMGYRSAVTPLTISPRQRLDDVCRQMASLPMGGTDCALPMLYAAEKKLAVDIFVVMTDNETWAGNIHPSQALENYRQKMGIPAKLVVVGMTSTEFTIADPSDFGMMDVVGFDTAAPSIMADFARS